jgi:hypothetical protein
MSNMSDLSITIQDAIIAGNQTFEEIAADLNVPLEWVESVHEEMLEYESDGQPSEMDEWLDFDPDC